MIEILLGEVGRRLSDRWLIRAVGPGLLWCAVAALGLFLGHRHPFGFDDALYRAESGIDELLDRPTLAVLSAVLAVLVATVVGLVARAVGALVRAGWLGQWRGPLRGAAARLAARRRQRVLTRLGADRTTLPAAYLPERPTWIGDRVRLADVRVGAQYGLRLGLIWPRLWVLLDTEARALVHDARDRFEQAGTLVGWAVLYAALATVWWPALPVAVVVATYGWWRGRQGAGLFADTVESMVDLHHRRLAEALGHPTEPGRPLAFATADVINDQLHKGASPYPQRQDSGAVSETTPNSDSTGASVSRERQHVARPPLSGTV